MPVAYGYYPFLLLYGYPALCYKSVIPVNFYIVGICYAKL